MPRLMICRTVAALALLTLTIAAARSAQLHVDTFAVNEMGWTGGGVPVRVPSGGAGDNGAYLRVPAGTNLATFNRESAWIGNYTGLGADRMIADLRIPAPTELVPTEPLAIRIVLFGPVDDREQRWTSVLTQEVPNDGVWRRYTFMLGAQDLLLTPQSTPQATHASLMTSVLRVMFRYDPGAPTHDGTSAIGELHIDNAQLAGPPPPPLDGDFDGDGNVDADDLNDPVLGWRARFGVDLDGSDFVLWQRNLGLPLTSVAASPVPEPTTGLAMFLAAAALGIRRRILAA